MLQPLADPLQGGVTACQAAEADGTAESRKDAQFDFGKAYAGTAGQNPEICCQTQLKTATERYAIDGRDRRHRQILECIENLVDAVEPLADGLLCPGEQIGELLDIRASNKAVQGAGDDKACQGR